MPDGWAVIAPFNSCGCARSTIGASSAIVFAGGILSSELTSPHESASRSTRQTRRRVSRWNESAMFVANTVLPTPSRAPMQVMTKQFGLAGMARLLTDFLQVEDVLHLPVG